MTAKTIGKPIFIGKTFNNQVVMPNDTILVEVYCCSENSNHRFVGWNNGECPLCMNEFKKEIKEESITERGDK